MRDPQSHKDIRGMLTLGECVHAPDFAGGGENVSTVILYYGSFVEIARRDPSFDVEAEIVETVRHEVRHHVEDQVGHAALRDMDWAEEQDALRRAGRPHAPNYWRAGEQYGDPEQGLRAVGSDLYLELELRPAAWDAARRDGLVLDVRGNDAAIPPGALQNQVEEVFEFEGFGCRAGEAHGHSHGGEIGDLILIVRRRRSLLDLFRGPGA